MSEIFWKAPGYPAFAADIDTGRIDKGNVRRAAASRGAGIWRANHKTLVGAWAERAYPEGHLIDNNEGAAAA